MIPFSNAIAASQTPQNFGILKTVPLGGDINPSFGVNDVSFARASGVYVNDFEGVPKYVPTDVPAFEGSRVVTNLFLYSEDFSNAAWIKGGTCTVTGTNVVNFPALLDKIYQRRSDLAGKSVTFSAVLSGTGTLRMEVSNNIDSNRVKQITLSETPTRFSLTHTFSNTASNSFDTKIYRSTGNTTQVTVTEAQLENVTGQTNKNPSEYIKTTSAAVTKSFDTTNGNTVDGNGVVTEAAGIPLHPWTYEQGVKRYLTFSARENSTAYTLGKRIHATATDGLEHWYTCTTAGTSHSSAPTFPITGTVAEGSGTVVWTYGGLYRIKGLLLEPASVNKCACYGVPRADSLGSSVVTGNNSTMSGTNSWSGGSSFTTFDINTTVAGKMYILGGAGSVNYASLPTFFVMGKWYFVSGKFRLNAGASTIIRVGGVLNGTLGVDYFEVTPTGTEQTFTGYFQRNGASNNINIGLASSLAGIAFEIDDVTAQEAIDYVGTKAYHNGTAFQNPIPGMTLSGDVAAVLSIVQDQTAIETAKLGTLTNNFKVYEVYNPGAGVSLVDITGTMAAVVTSMGLLMRKISGTGNVYIYDNAAANTSNQTSSSNYVMCKTEGFTATAGRNIRVRVGAGITARFLLPVVEEQPILTSLMPSVGATASRAATVVSLPVSGNIPATAGWQESINHIVTQTTGTQMIWCVGDTTNGLRLFHTGAIYCLQKIVSSVSTYVTIAKTLVLGEVNKILVRVNSDWTCNLFLNGVKDLGGVSANLFVNSTFETDTDWTKGLAFTIDATNKWAVVTGSAGVSSMYQSASSQGKLYQSQFEILTISAGSIKALVSSTLGAVRTTTGVFTELLFGTGTTGFAGINTPSSLTVATVDNVYLREVYNNTDTTPIVLGTTLYLGADSAGASHINGCERNFTVKQVTRPDAECINFTSKD